MTQPESDMRSPARRPGKNNKKPGNLFLFYILPFVAINLILFYAATAQPDFNLTVEDPGDYKNAELTVELKNKLPLSSFTVKLDDQPIQMEKRSKRLYTASLSKNGTLEVQAAYKNGMIKTRYEHISAIDDAPPVIVGEELDKNRLTVSFEDSQSGVSMNTAFGIDGDGNRLVPVERSDKENSAVFQVLTDSLDVHVSDHCGNEAIAVFSDLKALGNDGEDHTGNHNTYGNSSSETKKNGSETKKASSETKKSSSETKKAGSETKKAGSETKKAGSETKKAGSETKKAGSETKKADSETKKAGSETKKADSETKKVGSETKKADSETKKAGSETKKADSETKKAGSETKKAGSEESAGTPGTPETGKSSPASEGSVAPAKPQDTAPQNPGPSSAPPGKGLPAGETVEALPEL